MQSNAGAERNVAIRDIESVLDIDVLRRNIEDDFELLADLITAFQKDLPGILAAIESSGDHRDGVALSRAAHKVKGSLLVFGARCANIAGELEREAKSGYSQSVSDLCAELACRVVEVLPALKRLVEARRP